MIRNATVEDIPKLVEFGQQLHDTSTYKHINYAPEKVEATMKTLIAAGFAVVAVKDGEVVGGMAGDVHTPWYSHDRMGFDYSIYIEPQHRNGLIAVKMIKRFEEWCIGMGAKQIRPGIGTGDPSVLRLYKALGYNTVGECLLKDI